MYGVMVEFFCFFFSILRQDPRLSRYREMAQCITQGIYMTFSLKATEPEGWCKLAIRVI